MKNYSNFVCFALILLFFVGNCSFTPSSPVLIVDNKHVQGGKNIVIKVDSKPITYDGTTVIGVPGAGKETATAVIYQDATGKFVTEYSNTNQIVNSHIEWVQAAKDAKYIRLVISRMFYYKDNVSEILRYACLLPTLGYSFLLFNPESYSDHISFGEGGVGDGSDITLNFVLKKDFDIMLTVSNMGNMELKQPFIISDTLPDYMLFKNAKYYASGGVAKVTYDNHKMGNNQSLVFKVYPNESGFGQYQTVQIKLTISPDLSKFLNDYKVNN